MRYHGLGLSLFFFLFGCSGYNEKGRDPVSPTSGNADISYKALTPLTEEDVRSFLRSADFYRNDLSAFESEEQPPELADSEDPCREVNEAKISASADTITILIDADYRECMNKGQRYDTKVADLYVFMTVKCPGRDVSSYNGRSISSFANRPCYDTLAQVSHRSVNRMELTSNETNLKVLTETYETGPEGGAVTIEPLSYLELSDHISVQYSETEVSHAASEQDAEAKNSEQVIKFVVQSSAIDGQVGDRYFSAGTYTVMLNGWSGTVTNTAPDLPPTFTLTKDGTAITGSLEY